LIARLHTNVPEGYWNSCAINDESEVVVDVKLSAFDLLSVANANPAPHPVGAAELLDLHEGWLLTRWWLPFVRGRAVMEDPVGGCWCVCIT
jgi:hypothetical protein